MSCLVLSQPATTRLNVSSTNTYFDNIGTYILAECNYSYIDNLFAELFASAVVDMDFVAAVCFGSCHPMSIFAGTSYTCTPYLYSLIRIGNLSQLVPHQQKWHK